MAVTFGSEYAFTTIDVGSVAVALLDATHFVAAYASIGKCVIGTISGNTISYGSEYTYNNATTSYVSVVALDSTHFIVSYSDGGNSGRGTCIVGVVSNGNEIAYGSEYALTSGDFQGENALSKIDSTHFVCAYNRYTGSNYDTKAVYGTIASGNQISYGTEASVETTTDFSGSCNIDSTHFIVGYAKSSQGLTKVGTISGTSITFGDAVSFSGSNHLMASATICQLDSTHYLIAGRDNETGYGNDGKCVLGTLSGTTMSYGSLSTFDAGDIYNVYLSSLSSTHFIISYRDAGDSSKGYAIYGTLSGTTLSYDTRVNFNNASSFPTSNCKIGDSSFVIVYGDNGNSGYGTAIIGSLPAAGPANVKTYKGLASASTSKKKGLAISSTKTAKGLA